MKIHVKNPTTTVFPTTTTVFNYEPLVFYEFSGECEDCLNDSGISLSEETTTTSILISNLLNQGSSYLGLFLNLIHLLILTRKELRSNSVFFIMIGICVCDILTFSACIVGFLTKDDYWRRLPNGDIVKDNGGLYEYECLDNDYWKKKMTWYSKGMEKFGRHCATILALAMTLVRTTSVLFPMSSVANSFVKFKTAVIMVLGCYAILGSWYVRLYYDAVMMEDIVHKKCYFLGVVDPNVFHEGFIILAVTVLYLILTVILLVELHRVKRRRKQLRFEKPDNTFNLIVAMAVSFFIAELAYSGLFIASTWPFGNTLNSVSASVLVIVVSFRSLPYAMMTLNSIAHCFVCFLMSSQYRETVLKICRRSRKDAMVPAAVEATRTDSGSRRTAKRSEESSRKTY